MRIAEASMRGQGADLDAHVLGVGVVLSLLGLWLIARGVVWRLRIRLLRGDPRGLADEVLNGSRGCTGASSAMAEELASLVENRALPTDPMSDLWGRLLYQRMPTLAYVPTPIRELARTMLQTLVVSGGLLTLALVVAVGLSGGAQDYVLWGVIFALPLLWATVVRTGLHSRVSYARSTTHRTTETTGRRDDTVAG